jgi:hypothetical protein
MRREIRQCHTDLEACAAMWLIQEPDGSKAWSARARLYLHALCIEDITIQSVLRERAPLFASLWPDLSGPADLAALHTYARAVYSSTEAYFVELPADGLSRSVDLRKLGLGRRTVAWIARRFVVQELGHICAEIDGATGAARPVMSSPALPA